MDGLGQQAPYCSPGPTRSHPLLDPGQGHLLFFPEAQAAVVNRMVSLEGRAPTPVAVETKGAFEGDKKAIYHNHTLPCLSPRVTIQSVQ